MRVKITVSVLVDNRSICKCFGELIFKAFPSARIMGQMFNLHKGTKLFLRGKNGSSGEHNVSSIHSTYVMCSLLLTRQNLNSQC